MSTFKLGDRVRFTFTVLSFQHSESMQKSMEGYVLHSGQTVEVITGLHPLFNIYGVVADDGWKGSAFPHELESLETEVNADYVPYSD